MRRALAIPALACALVASTLVLAGDRHGHHSESTYSWSENGQAITLHSDDASGIVVVRTVPTPYHGLQRGDVVVALDGRPVARVDALLEAIRVHGTAPIVLRVRRARSEVTVTWDQAAIRAMFPPAPPPPPR